MKNEKYKIKKKECAIFDNSLLHPDLVYEKEVSIERIINEKIYEIIMKSMSGKS